MNSNADFTKMVLAKYPDAIIHIGENGHALAGRKNNNAPQLLGCVLCFGDPNITVVKNQVFIQGIEAVSATSVIEDDSMNPAMIALFFCPICSRIIVHPDVAKLPAVGRAVEDWKD